MQLASASVLPMALKVTTELDVFEIISRAGPDAYLSASEIALHLHTENPDAATMLDRVLSLLTSYSVLKCSLVKRDNDQVERRYGLAPVCKFFTNSRDGVSLRPLLLLHQDKLHMDSWYQLRDAILEGGIPFHKEHGMTLFQYCEKDSRYNEFFNKGMSGHTTIVLKKILDTYKGFEGLKEVVDVGGGNGTTLKMITSRYPQIKGINFDLLHVIEAAPSYPGVKHVGGDMFEYVPKGEAIFMKWILHDWNDEDCLKILRNCWKALPKSGKVIIVESILPMAPEASYRSNIAFTHDLVMLTHCPGGKERTQKEFEALAIDSGFAGCEIVCNAYHTWVMEFHK
uniref:Caffeic acid 3-O-methyltransferase-like n=1 Tax=Nelumbo nucifera TaxID=4432 RepID=A0A822ZJP6_NELNU|nr:TPA_asm: hypothetical protein HUJ06_016281 [Nelumbo nucifera]